MELVLENTGQKLGTYLHFHYFVRIPGHFIKLVHIDP